MEDCDRISKLPNDILHIILSSLPMEDNARTCILSRRWHNLWSSNPTLNFSFDNFSEETLNRDDFDSIRGHCLFLCTSAERLYSLQSNCAGVDDSYHIVDFFRFAAHRHVQRLLFSGVEDESDQSIEDDDLSKYPKVPLSLFACRSLSFLELKFVSFPSKFLAVKCGFSAMKTVEFCDVKISSEALEAMLSACPFIECLRLSRCLDVDRIVIRSETIRTLEVCYGLAYDVLKLLEFVFAPQLRFFEYSADPKAIRSLLENAPNLEEVIICNFSYYYPNDVEAMRSLHKLASTVRTLTLAEYDGFRKYISEESYGSDIVFSAKELAWDISQDNIGKDIMCMFFSLLKACPFLENLRFNVGYDPTPLELGYIYELMQEVENENFFPKLRTVSVVNYYVGGQNFHMELIKYILRKAPLLESLAFFFEWDLEEDKMNKTIEVVQSFYKMSAVASLSFIKPSP